MQTLLDIVKNVLTLPTAPFREHAVRAFVTDFCKTRGLDVREDKIGNVIATYGEPYKGPALACVAHMDHPGLILTEDSKRGSAKAIFYGGVEAKYFAGAPVRVFGNGGEVQGRVTSAQHGKAQRGRSVRLAMEGPAKRGDFAMWDLPAYRIRGDRLYSRACDDLIGCAAILALIDHLYRSKLRSKVMAVFTIGEEAGLHGAKYVCMQRALPPDTRVISIETSSVLPSAKMGDGAVIRVGDRASIFDPAVTDWIVRQAQHLQESEKTFKYQRKLMDAGTCEATVFSRFGYACGAVCIPLGNYHNRNIRTGRIAAEFVSIADLKNMVRLFAALAENAYPFKTGTRLPRYKTVQGQFGEIFFE